MIEPTAWKSIEPTQFVSKPKHLLIQQGEFLNQFHPLCINSFQFAPRICLFFTINSLWSCKLLDSLLITIRLLLHLRISFFFLLFKHLLRLIPEFFQDRSYIHWLLSIFTISGFEIIPFNDFSSSSSSSRILWLKNQHWFLTPTDFWQTSTVLKTLVSLARSNFWLALGWTILINLQNRHTNFKR